MTGLSIITLFWAYRRCESSKATLEAGRIRGFYGIAVNTDERALLWQRYDRLSRKVEKELLLKIAAQEARIHALEAQAALDAKMREAAMALIVKGEPIVAKDDVELQCGVCHGTRWGPCEDIPVAEVLNDTVQHTDDCEWIALEAAVARREKGG